MHGLRYLSSKRDASAADKSAARPCSAGTPSPLDRRSPVQPLVSRAVAARVSTQVAAREVTQTNPAEMEVALVELQDPSQLSSSPTTTHVCARSACLLKINEGGSWNSCKREAGTHREWDDVARKTWRGYDRHVICLCAGKFGLDFGVALKCLCCVLFSGADEGRRKSDSLCSLVSGLEWLYTLTRNVPRAPHALIRGRLQASTQLSVEPQSRCFALVGRRHGPWDAHMGHSTYTVSPVSS